MVLEQIMVQEGLMALGGLRHIIMVAVVAGYWAVDRRRVVLALNL